MGATITSPPGHIKGLANFSVGAGPGFAITRNSDMNVSNIVRNGLGDYTITWAAAFKSANYMIVGSHVKGTIEAHFRIHTLLAGSARFVFANSDTTPNDPTLITIIAAEV